MVLMHQLNTFLNMIRRRNGNSWRKKYLFYKRNIIPHKTLKMIDWYTTLTTMRSTFSLFDFEIIIEF